MTFPTDKQIREAILELLKAKQDWQNLMEIIRFIEEKYKTNLSPIAVIAVLANMVGANEILLEGTAGTEQSKYHIA